MRAAGARVVDDQGRGTGAVTTIDVTEHRRLEARLREAALHDALTGLPNRALLLERLAQALRVQEREGLPAVLLYCDLDGFEEIDGRQPGGHGVVLSRPGDTPDALLRPADAATYEVKRSRR